MHCFMRESRNYRNLLILRYSPKDFCQSAVSSLKLYVHAKPRSIDSCQNGRSADHCHKTNVGQVCTRPVISPTLPFQTVRFAGSPFIQIFAILMKANWQRSNWASADHHLLTLSRAHFLPIEFTYILKFSADILFDHELNSEFLEWETHIKRVYSHIWFVWMV